MKQLFRREFLSALHYLQESVSPEEMVETPVKIMMKENLKLCFIKTESILRDTDKGLQCFSWEAVRQELESKAPTIKLFYRRFFQGASKPLICFAFSMIIEWRSPKMCSIQRVESTLLYGNSANKKARKMKVFAVLIYNCLQLLMVFLSYNGMIVQMKRLAEGFDLGILDYSEKLASNLKVTWMAIFIRFKFCRLCGYVMLRVQLGD